MMDNFINKISEKQIQIELLEYILKNLHYFNGHAYIIGLIAGFQRNTMAGKQKAKMAVDSIAENNIIQKKRKLNKMPDKFKKLIHVNKGLQFTSRCRPHITSSVYSVNITDVKKYLKKLKGLNK